MGMLAKCLGLILTATLAKTVLANDNSSLWHDNNELSARSSSVTISNSGLSSARSLTLDTAAMKSRLIPAPQLTNDFAQRSRELISLELPLPSGENISVELEPTNLLPESLKRAYPSIRSYQVAETTSEVLSGRLDFTSQGFHAMLLMRNGETVFIDPEDKYGGTEYLSYRKSDQQHDEPFQCSTPEAHDHSPHTALQYRTELAERNSQGLREYRIAIAATAEYTSRQGGSVESALSAIVTTLNRVNMVYESSLGVRLTLVENNDQIIYTSSSSDPYSNFNIDALLTENQNNLDQVIGSDNYDIGHVFGTSGGGLAYIRSLCNNDRKAMAASGIHSPFGDSFDIDFVAHELGHQLGATHTFNGTLGICTSGARTARSAFEPGSGSSIMSYAGGCASDDLQSNADAMFHSGNIDQIKSNTLLGTGSHCGIQIESTNRPAIVSAGHDHIIPANTPFELVATATDPDEDPLLYSWEQYDTGTATSLKADTGDNPLFRIFKPNTAKSRIFPSIKTLTGREYIPGEMLPQTDRTMKFQVAVYDQHNLPQTDQTQISVINTGSAFKLDTHPATYQSDAHSVISWNTANTQNPPINCSTVDLFLSTNNGSSFDYRIANNISNSGSTSIYLPSYIPQSSSARFKLKCSTNIFFSISSQSFAISRETPESEESTRGNENSENSQESAMRGGGSISYYLSTFLLLIALFRKRTLS